MQKLNNKMNNDRNSGKQAGQLGWKQRLEKAKFDSYDQLQLQRIKGSNLKKQLKHNKKFISHILFFKVRIQAIQDYYGNPGSYQLVSSQSSQEKTVVLRVINDSWSFSHHQSILGRWSGGGAQRNMFIFYLRDHTRNYTKHVHFHFNNKCSYMAIHFQGNPGKILK